jgi:hypothetical protein
LQAAVVFEKDDEPTAAEAAALKRVRREERKVAKASGAAYVPKANVRKRR